MKISTSTLRIAQGAGMNVLLNKTKISEAKSVSTLIVFTKPKIEPSNNGEKKSKKTKAPTKKSSSSALFELAGVDSQVSNFVKEATADEKFSGRLSESLLFRNCKLLGFKNLLVVGLGDVKTGGLENLRKAAGNATKILISEKLQEASVGSANLKAYYKPAEETYQALCEGLLLAAQGAHSHKSSQGENSKPAVKQVQLHIDDTSDTKAVKNGLTAGQIIAEAVLFARFLGDQPGNMMTPTILSEEAVKAGKGVKNLKVSHWNKERIKKERMGGLLGVSSGSAQPPTFTIMEYKGNPTNKKHIALVGKGLTFDCGGISIKPAPTMEEMKFDMCGGATVLATVLALAKSEAKVNVTAYVPASENLTGSAAIKPGDIITIRNGKTIEVNNTDAEGRLILADALVYACEQQPVAIIDAATLTGAMVIALGNLHTGVFSRDEEFIDKIKTSAQKSGELVWHMPLVDAHGEDMAGTYADLSNISSSRGAGSSTAAAFLENFVDKSIPWAHFDIAGTANNVGGRLSYCPPKGASGAMVRTFVELVLSLK
jgi:leucyl aminopeptidase